MVRLFLCHGHCLGSGHTSEINFFVLEENIFISENVLNPSGLFFSAQFLAMEVVITSIIDKFPNQMRRAGQRERLLFVFCLFCFFSQLIMITEVSI